MRNSHGVLALTMTVTALSITTGLASANPADGPDPIVPGDDAAYVNAALGLSSGTLLHLDVERDTGDEEIAAATVIVAIEGRPYTLDLRPVTVRSSAYRVYTVGADGVRHAVEPAPSRTMRGELAEAPGSIAAASILDDGLHARLEFPDGRLYWIEPIARLFPRDAWNVDGVHVVYADEDVLPTGGVCATPEKILVDRRVAADARGAIDGAADGELFVAELACDADFAYYQDYGSSIPNVENRINAVINQVNVQYERDVQITHEITAILVRTSQVYTSSDPGTLLGQFQNRWNANHGDIQRDVAHLFTGRNLNGGVIGIAFIGVICNLPSAYGLVESDFNGNFQCATDLSAHELGHNWNAGHCNCPNSTMNPGITCTNEFSQGTINTIIAFRDSRNCLETGGGGGPENDDCGDASTVGNGSTSFSTVGATTDGPTLPGSCDEGFGLQFVNDIWYAYTATCTGTVTVSLCDSDYDTRLAVYDDGNCPGSFVACNDDACGTSGLRSETTFASAAGSTYLIRIGGFDSSGTGTMEISCEGVGGVPNDDCGDATVVGDGNTDFSTIDATTDGPALPGSCDEGFGLQFVSDVWYAYTASCSGIVTVSLCDSDYDTRLAVYNDGNCPGSFVACNDDACGTSGLRSETTFAASAGSTYLVRVGGFATSGTGTMVIGCEGEGACPEDLDNSGSVDFGDILEVLAVWGPCGGCPEDLDGSGAADFGDINIILAAWGACP